ncbi:MAG: copper resistance protein CopC [Pseudomonadota bacterium]
MYKPAFVFIASLATATVFAAPARADVKLVKSNPAANAVVAKPTKIELTFSDKIVGSTAISQLVMMTMAGMTDHQPMLMREYSAQMSKDGKTMALLLRRPLPVGTYDLKYEVTGADKHKIKGVVSFGVK